MFVFVYYPGYLVMSLVSIAIHLEVGSVHQVKVSLFFSITPFSHLPTFLSLRAAVVYCRRTPIGVIRCRSSLRSARTVLENAIVITVSIVVPTVIPTGTVTVIVLGQRPNRQGTG